MNKIRKILNIIFLFIIFVGVHEYCYADMILSYLMELEFNKSLIVVGATVIIFSVVFVIILPIVILNILNKKRNTLKEKNLESFKNKKDINVKKCLRIILIIGGTIVFIITIGLYYEVYRSFNLIFLGLILIYILFLKSCFINNKKANVIIKSICIISIIILIGFMYFDAKTTLEKVTEDYHSGSYLQMYE